jgi:hypothetical protein
MKLRTICAAALLAAWSPIPAHSAEIAKFYFAFEASNSMAPDGALDGLLLDHAANEIAKRGLTTVMLHTSCDTAETNCERVSIQRHNVVALALLGKLGLGKIKFDHRHWKTSALAVETGPDVREPLNRTVTILTAQ